MQRWSQLRADSPNHADAPGPLRVIDASKKGANPVDRILAALAKTSAPRA
jgi:hypothetical protein